MKKTASKHAKEEAVDDDDEVIETEKVEEPRSDLNLMVESFYDLQTVRQEAANRARAMVRARLEGDTNLTKKKKSEDKAHRSVWTDKQLMEKLAQAHEKGLVGDKDFAYLEIQLDLVKGLKTLERKQEKAISTEISVNPLWVEHFSKVAGFGPLLMANLYSFLGDCEQADTPSQVWRYAGLAVIDGKAERRTRGEQCHFNPKLKTLCWKIGDCFIKQGKGYRALYDQFKKEYQKEHPKPVVNPTYTETGKGFKKKYTKMHIHLMAMRKTLKVFLCHYWVVSRKMKGLPTRELYVQEKLGHTSIIEPFTDKGKK
jgi:hypothetical protein